jgi:hypothetical protein
MRVIVAGISASAASQSRGSARSRKAAKLMRGSLPATVARAFAVDEIHES